MFKFLSFQSLPSNDAKPLLYLWMMALSTLALVSCATSSESIQPTATDTETPTSVPTATSSVTDTPETIHHDATETQEPPLNYSAIMLKPADLPSGFEELQSEFMGVSPQAISGEHFALEASSILWRTTPFELVLVFSQHINRVDQADFDHAVEQADELVNGFLAGLGALSIGDRVPSPSAEGLGESASGFSVHAELEKMGEVRIEAIVFRRGGAGIYLLIMYLAEEQPVIGVEELARKVDRRIIEALSEMEP